MLKKILIAIAVVLVLFVGVVSTQPNQFKLERSAEISAPSDIVFAQINDFRAWEAWSPWEKLDPSMKKTHSGAASGAGAQYHWVGNDQVGEGRMTITKATPPESVEIRLEFLKPFEQTNTTVFSMASKNESTTVRWAMSGDSNFMSKAFGLFVDMDKMVGGDFEKGLAALKSVSEKKAKEKAEEERLAKEAAEKAAAEAAAAAAQPAPK